MRQEPGLEQDLDATATKERMKNQVKIADEQSTGQDGSEPTLSGQSSGRAVLAENPSIRKPKIAHADSRSPEKHQLTAEEHNAKLLSDPHLAKSSTANPDFLNQYHQESRLHHLSTWKADQGSASSTGPGKVIVAENQTSSWFSEVYHAR